jgi:hypothetical protein
MEHETPLTVHTRCQWRESSEKDKRIRMKKKKAQC